ncbi:MAG: YbaB/EbfC family nucleoid-associated protein [Limosilactobacillus gorillae]|jgi:nucleoid-associated protein EbfC|uniref:YbaB/EbfC family nucleoid-associated protein n=1 Tax=Limosilactobacillus gorillae TaxID=1450649 RepID=UPI000A9214DA|nr:YbaB/EbfC family nucleoid-associated protein [Limosilactobacillus gorillae]MDO4855554.1 YbaB/EbfC family nucleoid-associated protein [Limosilactobacillus gorillae]
MMRGMNMQKMMKQAQKMQKQMMAEQEELAATEFVGLAPDDMVTVTLTGDKKVKDLKINPEAVDPDDVDMLSDLIVAALNDGLQKVDDATQDKMGKYTRGLGM